MLFNLFTEFLEKKGLLDSDKIKNLKEYQEKTRVKLGLIAVAENMITKKQADEINRNQALKDMRFGDIAIDLGYLTGEQLSELLDKQGNPYMKLCQALSDLGYMTLDEINAAFNEFAAELGAGEDDIEGLKADDVDVYTSLFIPDNYASYSELALIAVRTISRIISTNLSLQKAEEVASVSLNKVAYQQINGDKHVMTAINGEGNSVLTIAEGYAKFGFDEVDEDALDSVGEFINIINGLYATSLSYRKCVTELIPPVYSVDEISLPVNDIICVLPIIIEGKTVKLYLSVK